jgi:N-acyl-D-amino-acid deacylase
MLELAQRAMRDGAWGMSTGLIYVPGTYAKTDELVALSRVVHKYGGIYASHIRGEGRELFDAVEEALTIGRESGAKVHVSHFKASGVPSWGSLRVAAKMIQDARDAGQVVTADQYPYTASSTSLEATLFPAWSREGGSDALKKRLADPDLAERIRGEVARRVYPGQRIQIARYTPRPEWVGKSLDEIAEAEGRDVVDVAIDIQRQGGAGIVNFGMHEDDVRMAMQLPWVATASDGSAQIPTATQPHPRSFGTFTRKLGRYAIREKVLPLEQAVRSASGLPADILELTDRGYLRPDQAADLVVFDPAELLDRATFDEPFRYSTGIRYVLVDGVPAIFEGSPTGALAGKALRRPNRP